MIFESIEVKRGAGTAISQRESASTPITGTMLAVLVTFYLKPVFLKPVRFFLFPLEQTSLIDPSL